MLIYGEKGFNIFVIFMVIIILFAFTQFILSIILAIQVNSKLQKFPLHPVEDIYITGLKSFEFTPVSSRPQYIPSISNLGTAGKLYLDCYKGTCVRTETGKRTEKVCDNIYNDRGEVISKDCHYEIHDYTETIYDIVLSCSQQCFDSKSKNCSSCTNRYDKPYGTCSRNQNDNYNKTKICFADNLILFWKGAQFSFEKGEIFKKTSYSYLKDVILSNEECPKGKRSCGLVDNKGNKLCVYSGSDCPINLITDTKKDNFNYASTIIGNKTFYFTNDATKNGKIVEGIYADTDLSLKYKDGCDILDTGTLSEFLKDNVVLYRGVDLGFDPYKISNIDSKGKSYLKMCYNGIGKNPDLISMRLQNQEYLNNKTINNQTISPIVNNFSSFNLLGIISYIYLFSILSICLMRRYSEKNPNTTSFKFFENQMKSILSIFCYIFPFFITTLIALIRACINGNKFYDASLIVTQSNFDNLRLINKIYISFGFILYGIIISFFIAYCVINNRGESSDNIDRKTIEENTSNEPLTENISSNENQQKKEQEDKKGYDSQQNIGYNSQQNQVYNQYNAQPNYGYNNQQPYPSYNQQPYPGYNQQAYPGYSQQPNPGYNQQPYPGYNQQPYSGY